MSSMRISSHEERKSQVKIAKRLRGDYMTLKRGILVVIYTLLSSTLIIGYFGNGIDNVESPEYQETLTQVSTIGALINGVYDGVISYGELKKYGDFGIGTFEGLDGEMVALDREFYQIKSDGHVYKVKDSIKTPFACVTFFDTDIKEKLNEGMNYTNIRGFIDDMIPTKNIFYAIKIDGTFS
jgi:hypothetical protein